MSASGYRPWPRDAQGRLLAAVPVRGLLVEVHLGGSGPLFDRWRVVACSRTRFVAQAARRTEERAVTGWGDWLDARAAEGPLLAHLPGCARWWCTGCDTASLGRPGSGGVRLSGPPASPSTAPLPVRGTPRPPLPTGVSMPPNDIGARDVRVLRAAKDVLSRYSFHLLPTPEHGPHLCAIEVRGGSRPYVVTVDPAWGAPARCTCPDHARASNGGYCKHVIGVLLRDDALRCQLLELFL